jgi:hypothetical protein
VLIARAIVLAAGAAASRGELDTTPDAAGCSATVQPSVGVAAELPTPLDVASKKISQIRGQLQLGCCRLRLYRQSLENVR